MKENKEKQNFFQDALSNFTTEVAYGDAVKRLADEGYSVRQILDKIDYPAPKSKVEKIVFDRLCETNVILLDIPNINSFLRISLNDKVGILSGKGKKNLILEKINKKCVQNGVENSYILLDFDSKDISNKKLFPALDIRARDYIESIIIMNRKIYHQLNFTMREIMYCLCESDEFNTECCFLKTKEIIQI